MTKEENKARLSYLKSIVRDLPKEPGSYQFFDKSGKVIYVGKAKNLRNRVASYFHTEVDREKTKVLVSKIYDIKYFVVNREDDALLVENNMIKNFSPKYNILLKDGKTYPSICVTKELLPRIFSTRDIVKGKGIYFGPYSSIQTMRVLLDVIKKVYHVRGCNKQLTEKGIKEGKYKKCLKYDMGLCDAPCINNQGIEKYNENIKDAIEVLKGNTRKIENKIEGKMHEYADVLEFEKAEEEKKKRDIIHDYCSKSEVVSYTINDVDVVTIKKENDTVYLNCIHVKEGKVSMAYSFEYKILKDEDIKGVLHYEIEKMRTIFRSKAKEIIVPCETGIKIEGVSFTIPIRGDKRKLLELSLKNLDEYIHNKKVRSEKQNPGLRTKKVMEELKSLLKLPGLPRHIECFDNSNTAGEDAVSGCVVYKDLKPSKKDYRKYIIKTANGADDYGSMKEVVRRRYTRLKNEGKKMPDLILTDGGKGQMKVVRDIVIDELNLDIPIVGLAKNEHHRTNEVLIGNPPLVVGLDVKSEAFLFFTRVQDEVHRFAITYHKLKKKKKLTHSELDEIKGIGPKTKEQLLHKLKTVEAIKNAEKEILIRIVGESKAKLIREHFNKNE